ncbi:F-box protein CPR1-like [Vicia villosa]|uniref:F-box protein CPR1-like n=1 Tax=Vicia villosa TaxID=3911 RepID=UPI00273B8AA7|nr:F-box protein CPR1-like [Vicia villosa]
MKNSKSADFVTTEKVRNHVPNDLAISIISKLPLKSLARFRCIRKSWSLLFENPHFMNMYRSNFASNNNFSYDDDSCLTLELKLSCYGFHGTLFSRYGERFEKKVKLDWPPLFQEDNRCINIMSSLVDEMLCLYTGILVPKTAFWNLSTKEFKVLPPSPVESQPSHYKFVFSFMGFGYDRVKDDHKVIRNATEWIQCTLEDTESKESIWELYSLRNNSWRKLDVDIPLGSITLGATVHTNGVCHWWDRDEDCLVSFDLSSEVFFKTPLPMHVDDNLYRESKDKRFMALNGSIAFITTYDVNYGIITSTIHISILGEYGVKESWTKLFIVNSLPSYVDLPIGAGNKGDIFFKTKCKELVRFDLNTKKTEKLPIDDLLHTFQILLYKKIFLFI